MQQPGRLVVREDLADLSHEYGPRDTAQVAHDVGADSPILGPDLDHPERLLEVLGLLASEFEDHEVVLPAEQRGPALVVLDGVEQIHGNDLFDVPGNGLSLQLAEADIDLDFLVGEGDDGYLGVGSGCEVLDIDLAEESLGQSIKKMGLSLYKIRANTNKIDITAIGPQIEYITTEGEELSSIGVNFLLVDAHLMLGDFDAPLLDDVADEAHRLVLQQLLGLLLVEVVLSQDLLHQLGVDVRPLAFYHVEGLTVHQLLLDLVLSQAALAL